MQSPATDPKEYLNALPEERKKVMTELRNAIRKNIPEGFIETISYGMLSWVVPHSIYPAGYHAKPSEPLPFISIASQKSHIAVYHMGIYADPTLNNWFTEEYAKYVKTKLDMGKSCIRFKKPEQVPVELIGKLASKLSAEQWISLYEKSKGSAVKE